MFSMFSSEKWAKLYRAQLTLANGIDPKDWGYSCLFFDDKFNTLLRKKYAELNDITGSHFHIFSFVEPSRVLINSRIAQLNSMDETGEIDKAVYDELKNCLEKLKLDRKDQDLDHERQLIRKEIQKANELTSIEADHIDIILFDLKSIKDNSYEIPAIILNTGFREDEQEKMLKFIVEISEYAKALYISDTAEKDEKFTKYISGKCNNSIRIKVVKDLLHILSNLRDAFLR